MKTIALISGGKDSLLAVLVAKRYGHEPVVLANISPETDATHEIDSYMYQTVGHEVIESIADCMALPLRRTRVAKGHSKDQTLLYTESPDPQDEVETLYRFLKAIKEEFPEVQGVTTGAILSNYQRNRVESVCYRLQLTSLAYLWQRQATEILDMVEALHMEAILVKTASIGLDPRKHVGKALTQIRPTLEKLEGLYGSHMAGEGGEFETIVLNCPLFVSQRLVVRSLEVVVVDANEYAPSGHAIVEVECWPKSDAERASDAAVLSDLCNQKLSFPSDIMSALPRRPLRSLGLDASHDGQRSFAMLDHLGDVLAWLQRPTLGADSHVHTFSSPVQTANNDAREVVVSLLTKASANVGTLVIARCTFVSPTTISAVAVKEAYAALAQCVAPAICDAFSLETVPHGVAYLIVEVVPRAQLAETDVLHAQSVSCWAAGEKGPFALARRLVSADGERCVLTAATCGRTPVDWHLAEPEEFPPLGVDGVASLGKHQAEVAAQFAYAFANAAAYGKYFGCTDSDVNGITVYTSCPNVVTLLPALWTWCTGALVPSEVPCAAVLVADLGAALPGSHIAMSLHWFQMGV